MSQCNFMDKCAFYNNRIKDMQEVGDFVKKLYCQQKSERCNRLKDAGDREVSDVNNDMTPWGMNCKQ